MSQKRKMRELAMQIMFLWDAGGEQDLAEARQYLRDASVDESITRDALAMATGTWEQRGMIDARVEKVAPQWPPRRQPAVDRNLIRLAVWELTNMPTPQKVVLDEAIEMAQIFSTEQSGSFVNGVMDAVLQQHRALLDQTSTAERDMALRPTSERSPEPSPDPSVDEPKTADVPSGEVHRAGGS